MSEKGHQISKRTQAEQVQITEGGISFKRQGKPIAKGVAEASNVYLLIDCSGSMSGGKLDQAKGGAIGFAEQARTKGYRVGIIAFADTATHVCEPQEEIRLIQSYVQRLDTDGGTDMAAGITLATAKLSDKPGNKAVVIVTDGVPNDRNATLEAAKNAQAQGIDIITIGTDGADSEFLKKVASRNDLSVMVRSADLEEGIASTTKLLPSGRRS